MSEQSRYGKLIVVTGAGASAALNLPTMASFPRFYEGSGSALDLLCKNMAWREQGGDVEFIYDRLQLYREIFEAGQHDANIQQALYQDPEDESHLGDRAEMALAELQSLMVGSWGRVNAAPPGSLECYGTFLADLGQLTGHLLYVFTTNYDLAYESLPRFPIQSVVNGLRPSEYGQDRVWDESVYNSVPSETGLVIYRLHGCSHWFVDARGSIVYQAYPTLPSGVVRPMVVWPSHGKTDAMLSGVFAIAYRALREALVSANVVLVVGYSFRDIGITEALGSTRPDTYFVVVDPELNEGYIRTKLDGRRFTQVKGYFGRPTVNDAALEACRRALRHETQDPVIEGDDFIPGPWEDE